METCSVQTYQAVIFVSAEIDVMKFKHFNAFTSNAIYV